MMSKPTLILLCGLPASGKSTHANILKGNHCIILSSDEMREELYNNINDIEHNEQVFNKLYKRARQELLKGKDVIIDATNITLKSRRKALSHFEDIDCKKTCIIMATPYEECIRRNQFRERQVPVEVIDRMYKQFQIPFWQEGFDNISIIQTTSLEDIDYILMNMANFNQQSKHHKYTLFTHSKLLCGEMLKSKLITTLNIGWITSACILHDIGKIKTQSFKIDEANAHYYGHENVGAYDIMCIQRYSHIIMFLEQLFLINYHMLPFGWTTKKAQNKWKNIFGEKKFNLLVEFNRCDRIASGTEE